MKRIIAAALAAGMLLCLCACSRAEDEEPELNMEPLSPVFTPVPASVTDAESLPHEEPASAADIQTPEPEPEAEPEDDLAERFEAAQAFIGYTAEELIAALGEPESSQYAASCEVDGEDGMLFYNGFYVWTVRTEDEEIVRDVYPDD